MTAEPDKEMMKDLMQSIEGQAAKDAAPGPGAPLPPVETPETLPAEPPAPIEKDPNIDPTADVKIEEIWYDRRNWIRYVKTRHYAQTAEGTKPFHVFTFASCVEMSPLLRINEQVYERNKRYAEDGHALAWVINPGSPNSTLAENDLLLAMQAAYDDEPMAKGNRTIPVPSKWTSVLKEKL